MKRKNMIALAVAAVVAMAACGGVNLILKAREFAIGTWSCKVNGVTLAVGVKDNGTAVLRAPSGFEIPLTWKLEGTKLSVKGPKSKGPKGGRVSADFELDALDDGKISHTDTSEKGAGDLIGGKAGSVSNVTWDFDEKIVSFEAEGVPGVPTSTVYCHKTSGLVTLKPLPTTTTTEAPPGLNSLKDIGAALFWSATHDAKGPISPSIETWKQAFRELASTPSSAAFPKDLLVSVVDEFGWTPVFKNEKAVGADLKSVPTMIELAGAQVAVCMTTPEGSRPLSILDGACLS